MQEQEEINEYFRKKATNFLNSVGKLHLLEEAINKAVKLYTDKYSTR